MDDVYDMIDEAVISVLDKGCRTSDIMQDGCRQASCEEMGSLVVGKLKKV